MNPSPKPTRKHVPRKIIKSSIPEKDLQIMAEELCGALGVRFFRVPDKLLSFLRVYAPTWVRVFVARYLAGVPDMILFKPAENGLNLCKMIEIKTEAGNLSLSQKKWHSGLNVQVCYGWEETERAIREFHTGRG